MKLPKEVMTKEIEIFEPKWISREVYISSHKVVEHNIIYFSKPQAKKTYPDKYYLNSSTIKKYPIFEMPTKSGSKIKIYKVPLDEFVVYEGRDE